MKMLININTCVDKDIFNDKQLWQILSGKMSSLNVENSTYIYNTYFLFDYVLGIVFPILMWRPGKTAESLRAASCLCAQIITKKFTCFDETMLNLVSIYFYL